MKSTPGVSTSLRFASPEEREQIVGEFGRRFGIPAHAFDPYEILLRGRNVWIVRRSHHLHTALELTPETIGLRLARYTNIGLKPSTYASQVFGPFATRNVVFLKHEEAISFLQGHDLAKRFEVEPGFVIAFLDDLPLGCGLYKGSGLLKSLVPKKIRLDAPRLPQP